MRGLRCVVRFMVFVLVVLAILGVAITGFVLFFSSEANQSVIVRLCYNYRNLVLIVSVVFVILGVIVWSFARYVTKVEDSNKEA